MEKKELFNLLKKGYSIPPLSPVAMKLVEMAANDNCSAGDLANLIKKDPSLSVRLLKLANSAFFRTIYPVTTLNQAVVKVGFHRLRIMALSVSLRDAFPMGKIGSLDYEKFWQVSIYRALIARYLAKELKTCSAEEAFVAALIMEVGLLIFFDVFIKKSSENIETHINPIELESLLAWEKEKYGMDHRQIGEIALSYWKFPDPIVRCQQASGNVLSSETYDPLVRVCELARVLSQIILSNSEEFDAPFSIAQKYFGLDQIVINDILITTIEQVEDIADSLRVELVREKDLLRIMEKANTTLSRISDKISENPFAQAQDSLPTLDSLGNKPASTNRMLQAVAHEIRNPLTVIGGFARRLKESVDLDSAGSQYAQIIVEEAARLEEFLSKVTCNTKLPKNDGLVESQK